MSQFCHNCGTKLPDDAVFCSGCGTRVKLAEKPMETTANMNNIETVQPVSEPVQPVMETATTLEQEKTEEKLSYAGEEQPVKNIMEPEPITYTSPVEPPKAEEPVTYTSPVEPPKAEEPVTYTSPVEPPKAEEPVTYTSPVEPPKTEEPVTYTSPVEPLKTEEPASYTNTVIPEASTTYTGGASYTRPVTSMPPDQPIPGFGAQGGNPNKKNKPKKKKKGLLVFFIIVLLLAAGAAVVWFLDNKGIIEIFPKEEEGTYKEAIDLYVKGIEKQDLDTFLDAYGSFLVDEFADGDGEIFMEETYEEYESEAGSDLKIKYEVTKEKEYTESKLEKLQKELEEDYDLKDTIEKAYDITAKFTIKGDDGETDDRVKFLVVKIEGQWYLAEFDD